MAMAVKSNLSAARTLNVLNRNGKAAQRALRQAATGMKIVTAADNASSYVISERMRAELHALDQANQNVQNGSALLKTGAGGISNIVDNLRSLKELAINAANDSNTNADRSLIQTEFEQRIANINDIALKTNYNGRVLLDGTYSKKSFTVTETVQTTETIEKVAPKIIPAGDYTITEDGVYSLADGYTGTVTVNAQNVKLTQQTPATQLNNVSIVTRAEGNSNLWIEGLNIANTEDKSIIKFQGADNYLTVKGTNSLDNDSVRNSATIHIGNGLKIVGDGSLITKNSTFGAGIGSSGNPGGFTPEDSTAGNLTIGGYVIITATDVNHSSSALIGSGYKGTIGDILIGGNANVTATDISFGAAIGGGGHGDVGDILIGENATVNVQAYGRGAGIGSGEGASMGGNSAGDYYYSSIRNISIGNHAHVTAIGSGGVGIGAGGNHARAENIFIGGNANVTAISNGGA